MARILVIDDERMVCAQVAQAGTRLGHEVLQASNMREGLQLAAQGVDVVLLDVLLPDGNSLPHVREFASLPGSPELLVISGQSNSAAAELALRSGAWEYLRKPLRLPELRQALLNVLAYRDGLRHDDDAPFVRDGIIGHSQALLQALHTLREAAKSDVNVLLLGETGVGKELFAHALHANSPRHMGPLVTVDCSCLPETLAESALFGHRRGAFTGADRNHEGLMAAAHTGTLFLDEIGDLPLALQGSFMRAIESKRYRPLGQVQEIPSDFRLVAATNRNLDADAHTQRFRSDLLYRLHGLTIIVPPLRERGEDVIEIARHAVANFCRQHALPDKELTHDCLQALRAYAWPGNVRELIHAMEHACVACKERPAIFMRHLPTSIRVAVTRERIDLRRPLAGSTTSEPPSQAPSAAAQPAAGGQPLAAGAPAVPFSVTADHTPVPTLREWKTQAELAYLRKLLPACHGDVRRAAAMAGVSRGHLYELLKKHGAMPFNE